jgi:hypothetical protein
VTEVTFRRVFDDGGQQYAQKRTTIVRSRSITTEVRRRGLTKSWVLVAVDELFHPATYEAFKL